MNEQQYYELLEKLEEIERKLEEYNGRISKLEWEALKNDAKKSEKGEKEEPVLVSAEFTEEKITYEPKNKFDIEKIIFQTGITICLLGVVFFATMGIENLLNKSIAIIVTGFAFVAASFVYRWVVKRFI